MTRRFVSGSGSEAKARRKARGLAPSAEAMEGRLVLSGFGGGSFVRLVEREVRQFFADHVDLNRANTGGVLHGDAQAVRRGFDALDSSFASAAGALRLSATSTGGPSAAGLTAYNASIASAVGTLNATITSDLANLPKSGSGLSTTIAGETSALQAQLQSAGAGLASSKNGAVLALKAEGHGDIRSTLQATTSAILDDSTASSVTVAQRLAYDTSANAAYRTFRLAIDNAEQASITGGTALSSSAVTSAVSALQTSLTAGITGLGASFAASTFNPTPAVTTDLTGLTTSLTSIAAPTAGNPASTNLFLRTVSMTIENTRVTIGQGLSTAIQSYNASLL